MRCARFDYHAEKPTLLCKAKGFYSDPRNETRRYSYPDTSDALEPFHPLCQVIERFPVVFTKVFLTMTVFSIPFYTLATSMDTRKPRTESTVSDFIGSLVQLHPVGGLYDCRGTLFSPRVSDSQGSSVCFYYGLPLEMDDKTRQIFSTTTVTILG